MKKPSNASKGYFYIRTRSGSSTWSVTHEYHVKNKKVQKAVPKDGYMALGFRPGMSIIEAKERAQQLNKQRALEDSAVAHASRRAVDLVQFEKVYFPEGYVDDFVENHIEVRLSSESHRTKLLSHFAFIQKMILSLKLTPDLYKNRQNSVFRYFKERGVSLDYTKKLINMLNQWGSYFSYRNGVFYMPLTMPRSQARHAIRIEQKKRKGRRRAAEPLTPELLDTMKTRGLSEEHFNWLFISLWLGLRPTEVDSLKEGKPELVRVDDEVDAIKIFQSKLEGSGLTEDEDLTKYIPLIYDEQRACMELIEGGTFERPHPKTIKQYSGGYHDTYSGRKGFTDLMLDLGQGLEDISMWLGHKDISTTWVHYKDRKRIKYKKAE